MARRQAICALVIAVCLFTGTSVCAQPDRHTPKTIFTNYRAAIVRVLAAGPQKDNDKNVVVSGGTGFVVSRDLIITANHIVTREGVAGYLPSIQVTLSSGKVVKVTPILEAPTTESKLYDYAVLRAAEPLNVPALPLGTWKDAAEGDQLTTIGNTLRLPKPLLLSVTTSACITFADGVDVIVFQGPNNKGLSGAPLISNRTGRVVGIVTSRLIGIGDKLAEIRRQAADSGGVRIGNVDPNKAIFEIIDVLDAHLMSGMGAAVAVDYVSASVVQLKKQ